MRRLKPKNLEAVLDNLDHYLYGWDSSLRGTKAQSKKLLKFC